MPNDGAQVEETWFEKKKPLLLGFFVILQLVFDLAVVILFFLGHGELERMRSNSPVATPPGGSGDLTHLTEDVENIKDYVEKCKAIIEPDIKSEAKASAVVIKGQLHVRPNKDLAFVVDGKTDLLFENLKANIIQGKISATANEGLILTHQDPTDPKSLGQFKVKRGLAAQITSPNP